MHIVQMIDSLGVGGAERLQVTLAEALAGRGFKMTVISLADRGETQFVQALRALGVNVHVLPASTLLEPRRLWRLLRLLRAFKPDMIHAHLTSANVIAGIVGRLLGVPVVATLHNTAIAGKKDRAARIRLETWMLRYGVQRVMAVGHVVADAHRERLRGKMIDIIPNAVPVFAPLAPEKRELLRREITGDLDRILLVSVGRLTEQKGYADLVAAFARVYRKHPGAFLAIAGKGELHDELAAQIKAAGLEGSARLLGVRQDIPDVLAASDVFVSSSLWEGLPVAVLEAMSAGLPIVATGVGDVPRVVVAGTGEIVPPGDPEQLAGALDGLLGDAAKRAAYGAAAREHIASTYNPSDWAERILALYRAAGSRVTAQDGI